MSIRETIKAKLATKSMTLDELFSDLNKKNNIKRESVRGRLSELRKDREVKKTGQKFSLFAS